MQKNIGTATMFKNEAYFFWFIALYVGIRPKGFLLANHLDSRIK